MRILIALAMVVAALSAPAAAESPADSAALPEPAITDPDDQFWEGFNLLHGRGRPRDPAASTPWFALAAEQGHLRAQVHMAMAYAKGRGVEIDPPKSLDWFLLAADAGHSNAQLEAGLLLFDGKHGVTRDRVEAAKWFVLAMHTGGPGARARIPAYLKALTRPQHRQGLQRARAWREARGLSVPPMREPEPAKPVGADG